MLKIVHRKIVLIMSIMCFLCFSFYANEASCAPVCKYNSMQMYDIFSELSNRTNKFQCSSLVKSDKSDFDGAFIITKDHVNVYIGMKELGTGYVSDILISSLPKNVEERKALVEVLIYFMMVMEINMDSWETSEATAYKDGGMMVREVWSDSLQKQVKVYFGHAGGNGKELLMFTIKDK